MKKCSCCGIVGPSVDFIRGQCWGCRTAILALSREEGEREAHKAVLYAIRRGELERPGVCSACGKACRPDAHHEDYERPLDVEWLCRSCHVLLHREAA